MILQQLVSSLSPDTNAYNTNLSILETAHSIFARWRSEMRSNSLYTTINFVLSRFVEPFLSVFRYTAAILLSNDSPLSKSSYETLAQIQAVLLQIFYDLTCQDLPPAIEDAHNEFFGTEQGWFSRIMDWDPEALQGDVSVSFIIHLTSSFYQCELIYWTV